MRLTKLRGRQQTSLKEYGRILSLEEELLVDQEIIATSAQLDRDINEIDRLHDIAENLEDIKVINESIETASDVEIALLQKAGDMAVAGTGYPADSVVPGLEDLYKTRQLSNESIGNKLNQIYEFIKKFLQEFFTQLGILWNQYVGIMNSQKNKLQKKLDQLKANDSSGIDGKEITVKFPAEYLMFIKKGRGAGAEDRRIGITKESEVTRIQTTDAMLMSVGDLERGFKAALNNLELVPDFTKAFLDNINSIETPKVFKHQIGEDLKRANPLHGVRLSFMNESGLFTYESKIDLVLPNCYCLVDRYQSTWGDKDRIRTNETGLEEIFDYELRVKRVNVDPEVIQKIQSYDDFGKITVKRNSLQRTLETDIEIIDQFQEYWSRIYPERTKQIKNFSTALENATSTKNFSGDFKAELIGIVKALAKMTRNPFGDLADVLKRSIRLHLAVVDKVLN